MKENEMYYASKTQKFTELMAKRLKENDHKGGWEDCNEAYLLKLLEQEVKELSDVIKNINPFMPESKFPEQTQLKKVAIREATDVANFALMIADVCGGLE